MIRTKTDDTAFTGLEAAIVLIAFVVVAAVFSYVVLGAGFFTTQKAQETVYSAVAQSTSNIQMTGQVYGLASGAGGTQINEIQFSIGLAPGAPSMDLSLMNIVYSRPDLATAPIILSYGGTTSSRTQFSSKIGDVAAPSLAAQQQVLIDFKVVGVPKNKVMNFEIRPSVGASLPFTRATPPDIIGTTVLY
ncbi:MAG: flagellin [Methanoregula sp.]|nr:flagellin [Methanoregula sp.]